MEEPRPVAEVSAGDIKIRVEMHVEMPSKYSNYPPEFEFDFEHEKKGVRIGATIYGRDEAKALLRETIQKVQAGQDFHLRFVGDTSKRCLSWLPDASHVVFERVADSLIGLAGPGLRILAVEDSALIKALEEIAVALDGCHFELPSCEETAAAHAVSPPPRRNRGRGRGCGRGRGQGRGVGPNK